MKRRQALVGGAAATTALAAGGSWWFGMGGSIPGKLAPSERLNVGIIGCGGHGFKLARKILSRKDCNIVHVCDPDTARSGALSKMAKSIDGSAPRKSQDLRRLLDDEAVEAVFVATPNHWHALAAVWAMDAGKDVYLEKPVSHTFVEGEVLMAATARTGRIVQAGLHRRSRTPLQEAIEYIHEGHLGEVHLARCLAYKPRKPIGASGAYEPPATVDYNLWAGPAPMAPITRQRFHYDWHWMWEFGDGGLGNNGVHRIDVARWGLQLEGNGDGVVSYGGRFGPADAGETPNTLVSVHKFGDKAVISELRGVSGPPLRPFDKGDGILFYGTEGILRYGSSRAALLDLDGTLVRHFDGTGRARNDHIGNFIGAIKQRDPSILNCPIDEGHYSSAMCHLASISYRIGSEVPDQRLTELQADPSFSLDGKLGEAVTRTLSTVRIATADLETKSPQPFIAGAPLQFVGAGRELTDNSRANALLGKEYRAGFELAS